LPLLAVWPGVQQAQIKSLLSAYFVWVCMSTYYQVYASYKLSAGKPSLVGLSLHSTSVYFPYLVGSYTSLLSQSRYFHTVKEAEHYINYLYSRYPDSTAPRPVLDALQPLLF